MDVDRLVAALRKEIDEEGDLAERMQSGQLGRVIFNLPRQTDKTAADQYLKRIADPARVLRMVTAHRKILELHQPHPDHWPAPHVPVRPRCYACYASDSVSVSAPWPCPTMLALAEVYGIQDSTEGGE